MLFYQKRFTMPDSVKQTTDQSPEARPDWVKKVRSTCDRCAALKVRCDKKKPSCERCESMHKKCVYGPYRWKGKPTANNESSRSPKRSVDLTSLEGETTSRSPSVKAPQSNIDSFSTDAFHAFGGFPIIPDLDNFQNDFDCNFWGSYLMQTAKDSHEIPGPNVLHFAGSVSEGASDLSAEANTATFLPPSSTPTLLDTTVSESVFTRRGSTPSGHRCLCISLAFSTLQELYQAELRCKASAGLQMDGDLDLPSSDQILKINRVAVQNLDQLLSRDCTACSRDTNMLFLIATISSKVLSWYRAVFNGVAPLSPSTKSAEIMESVSFTPIQFGDFKLDLVAERRMKAQFLLCELQNLSKVFDALADRGAGRTNDLKGTVHSVTEALHQFLSSALNDLMTRTDHFCVSKPSTVNTY